jgi:CO dehydrogenase/acetyl-CoA synthase gamma subunit (corrinoid Fe-S protein)
VSIEPGLYKSGNPSPESPIIVTANYEYTYIKVMRDLQGIDAWVLCLDSNGINVWCASRGENFGNEQLIEAVQNSGVVDNVKTKTMILPQLSAGGISIPKLPKSFPFHIKFGPLWSKDLKNYLQNIPSEKPESMRVIKFSLSKRLEAGITHTTFLLRMFLFWPTLIL